MTYRGDQADVSALVKYAQDLEAEIGRLRAALETCASWIDRWTTHAGTCKGGDKCTCGRTAVLFDSGVILNEQITRGHTDE